MSIPQMWRTVSSFMVRPFRYYTLNPVEFLRKFKTAGSLNLFPTFMTSTCYTGCNLALLYAVIAVASTKAMCCMETLYPVEQLE